jgi:integrase
LSLAFVLFFGFASTRAKYKNGSTQLTRRAPTGVSCRLAHWHGRWSSACCAFVDRSSRLGWRDYAILHLMAYYGLRPSEIITLTLGSIDWQTKTLRVKQSRPDQI